MNLMATKMLFLLLCLCFGGLCLCKAQTNTIEPGQVLQSSHKLLVSADGRFQLGFFNLSENEYLGLWYTDDFNEKVWVANRDRSVSGSNANLTLDLNGLLKITPGGGNDPIVLNSDQTAAQSSALTLENTGNLVLRELNPDGTFKRVLWESFDNPTSSLLPGMKLGINHKIGKKWMLTSWVSEYVPDTGPFSLEYNDTGNGSGELLMKHRGELYWRSGVGLQLIDNLLRFAGNQYYNFSYVSNENESYFEYSVTGGFISRWVLSSNGELADKNNYTPTLVADNVCSGYSSQSGCVEEELPRCRKKSQKFERRLGSFIRTVSNLNTKYDENVSISLSDCWDRCWKDCSCVAFRELASNDTGCQFWSEGAQFQQDIGGINPSNFAYLLNSAFPTSNKSDGNVILPLPLPLFALYVNSYVIEDVTTILFQLLV